MFKHMFFIFLRTGGKMTEQDYEALEELLLNGEKTEEDFARLDTGYKITLAKSSKRPEIQNWLFKNDINHSRDFLPQNCNLDKNVARKLYDLDDPAIWELLATNKTPGLSELHEEMAYSLPESLVLFTLIEFGQISEETRERVRERLLTSTNSMLRLLAERKFRRTV